MRTTCLFVLMFVSITQLKAQQLSQSNISGKTQGNSLYEHFKSKRVNSLLKTAPVSPQISKPSTAIPTVSEIMRDEIVDNMPVIKTRSDDKMPVVKPGDPNTHYTMLIQGYGKLKTDSVSRQP
ncbi:hypothetical protein [Mucilaginibacter aquaedulcis]|uniref:hypothetical protein n=1 Tax=Mucilaginibacter aquaedulcis TaxID=1187081 RepID=UPI0025B3EA31|nr:hypothetical protein [Mucilaginibacter aquaedulcis]MDN3550177.1 hypothetical protein [Mucilaginibacter aquaedulcis]